MTTGSPSGGSVLPRGFIPRRGRDFSVFLLFVGLRAFSGRSPGPQKGGDLW